MTSDEEKRQRRREYHRAWSQKNREYLREYHADWRARNPEKVQAYDDARPRKTSRRWAFYNRKRYRT
jgi:hypothetical protein